MRRIFRKDLANCSDPWTSYVFQHQIKQSVFFKWESSIWQWHFFSKENLYGRPASYHYNQSNNPSRGLRYSINQSIHQEWAKNELISIAIFVIPHLVQEAPTKLIEIHQHAAWVEFKCFPKTQLITYDQDRSLDPNLEPLKNWYGTLSFMAKLPL